MRYEGRILRAFTLVETLIAAGLSLFLAGLFITVFVPAASHSAQGSSRLELQQLAVVAQNQIQKALLQSRSVGVSYGESTLVIHPQISLDGSGQAVWDDQLLLVHHDETKETLGIYEVDGVTEKPSRFQPAQISSLTSGLSDAKKILARNVKEFEVTPPIPATATAPAKPLQITLNLEREIPGQEKAVQISLARNFSFRAAN